MNELILKGSVLSKLEKALSNYKSLVKENSHKWASYWLGVVDTYIFVYETILKGEQSEIVNKAKADVNYKGDYYGK